MKRISILLFTVLVCVSASAYAVALTGELASKPVAVTLPTPVQEVEINGNIILTIVQSNTNKLECYGNRADQLSINERNGKLIITNSFIRKALSIFKSTKSQTIKATLYTTNPSLIRELEGNNACKIIYKFPQLQLHKLSVDLSGASSAVVLVNAAELDLEASGASTVEAKGSFTSVDCDMSGASNARLAGSTNKVNLDASGASHINALGLNADFAEVEASGSSHIKMAVNQSLDAEAVGASSIRYKGAPVTRIKSAGASIIRAI